MTAVRTIHSQTLHFLSFSTLRAANASGSDALHTLASALIGLAVVAGSRQMGQRGMASFGRMLRVPPGTLILRVIVESTRPSKHARHLQQHTQDTV